MSKKRGDKGRGTVYQRKSDGRWVAKLPINGKTEYRYCATKKDAEDALLDLRNLERASREQPATDVLLGPLVIAQAVYQSRGLKRTSVALYTHQAKHMSDIVGDAKLCDANILDVCRSVDVAIADYHILVRKSYDRLLRKTLAEAHLRGLIDKDPMVSVDKPKAVMPNNSQAWTADEAERFLTVAQGDRYYPLFFLLLGTGLRTGEALALKWGDLLDGTTLRINKTAQYFGGVVLVTPVKNNKPRELELPLDTIQVLADHKAESEVIRCKSCSAEDLIFTGPNGRLIRNNTLAKRFHDLAAAAGVTRIRLYETRHTYVTLMAKIGIALDMIAKRTGHNVETLVKKYLKLYDKRTATGIVPMSQLLTKKTKDGDKDGMKAEIKKIAVEQLANYQIAESDLDQVCARILEVMGVA